MQKVIFHDVAEEWLKIASIGLSFTWEKQLASNVNHLNSYLGQKSIDSITCYDIEAIIKELYRNNPNTNKPASKRLLKAICQTANQIFDFAIEKKYITRNPAAKASKKIPKTAATQSVEAVNEYQISIITEYTNHTQLAALIMMFMGLRTGELLALKWSDFDFENCTVSINKRCSRISSNKFEIKEGTKNGKCRTVPIPRSICSWLECNWLKSSSNLVFPNNEGEVHTPSSWKRCWTAYQNNLNYYAYCKRCKRNNIKPKSKFSPTGIPDMNVKFNAHQLRHTFATLLYLSKVDVLTMKELMGHSNIQTTLGIYTHLNDKFKRVNIVRYDDYIKNELLHTSVITASAN